MAIDNQHHLPIAYLPKRHKSPQNDSPPRLRHDSYSVAWICALPIEMAAAQAMLDETHETLPTDADDTNTYVLGRIEKHNVVIACLPATQYGTNNAANVATNLIRTFPSIRAGLIVGIGGGVPRNLDMRLGDIVVGTRVMQYDLGKVVGVGQFQRAAVPRIPHHLLGTAVSSLRAKHELGPSRVFAILHEKLRRYPGYARPALPDLLFEATYDHVSSTANCDECNQSRVLPRGRRAPDDVVIHYGAIASGNQVMRSGKMRDEVASQLDVKCFEMEAAGLMDILPCLPIRGICDYSDSHKIKGWQKYAAAAAAAYATELLGELPLSEGRATDDYLLDPNPKYKNRKRLMDTLRFDRMQYRMKSMPKEHSRTCRWLLRHPKYTAWTDPQRLRQHHGFLWISGKPGAGKSTIMKYAYLKMKSKASLENHMTASFFFNARGEWLERSVGGMYRALLLQLLEGYPDLQSVLDNPDLISSDQSYNPSYSTLKDLLHNATMELRKRPFTCFVDALDECDEQQVVDMVQYFEDLAEESAAAGGQLRICFSSRHYPHIIIERGLRITLENEPGHASDMEAYLGNRLLIGDAKLLQELRPQILERAAGVFMWIVLVVTILNKEYRRGGQALRKRLAEIPGDLSRLFRDILERDNENMEQFALAIWWILYAKRPLRPDEFYHALWSGLRERDLVDRQVPDFSSLNPEERANIFNSYVVSSSKGLAEAPVTKQGPPTVQFIHESVRDFLIKDKALLELYPGLSFEDESNGHEILKQCCNAYINDELVCRTVYTLQQSTLGIETSKEVKLMQEKYPFLEYAAGNVLYHADAAASSFSQDEFLSGFKTTHWIHTWNFFQMDWDWLYSSDASLFYIFAERGHSHLIRTRLRTDPQVYVKGERYKYPLFAAVANGNRDAVAALLNLSSHIYNGVDVTESLMYRKRWKWYEGRTPVSWSAEAGGTAMVKLLLESGLPIDNADEDGRTPLSRSCETGMENVARLLIQLGAAIESRSRIGITPLGWACVAGQLAVVKLLIESGASMDTRDIYGRTVLFLASLNRYEDVASLLIDKGADVNAMDIERNTPLLSGSGILPGVYYGNSMKECNGDYQPMKIDRGPFVRLLVEHGADVNASNKYGYTPLLAASENGFDDIVKILLERGASVNIIDGEGQAPLSRAVAGWHVVTTKILLENGAHVNHRGPDGSTPLLQASRMGHGPSVEVLLEIGAEPNVRDLEGASPLHNAAFFGYANIAKLLIEHGADPNARDLQEWSPLHQAASCEHADVCMVLIENGAEVDIKDSDGLTPTDVAAQEGYQYIVDLMIQNGARKPG